MVTTQFYGGCPLSCNPITCINLKPEPGVYCPHYDDQIKGNLATYIFFCSAKIMYTHEYIVVLKFRIL